MDLQGAFKSFKSKQTTDKILVLIGLKLEDKVLNNSKRAIEDTQKKAFHSNSTSFLKSQAKKPFEAFNVVIKTIASSKPKPPIPTTLLNMKKEAENVLPNGKPVSQHITVGLDYRAGRKIGSGSFGELRIGKNIKTNEIVAIKFEKSSSPYLKIENEIYKLLSPHEGISNLHYYGAASLEEYNGLVMEFLGPNLGELLDLCGLKFSLKTVCMIAIQILQRIEFVHSKNIIYRDIKPENFLVGRQSNPTKYKLVHIIDFGLAKDYINPETGEFFYFNNFNNEALLVKGFLKK